MTYDIQIPTLAIRWAAAILLIAGCGRGTVPTSGTVALDGVPVGGAVISLVPEGAGLAARAIATEDGRFKLETFRDNGAMPGDYRIVVSKYEEVIEPHVKKLRSALPKIYASPETTPLRCTIPCENGELRVLLDSGQ